MSSPYYLLEVQTGTGWKYLGRTEDLDRAREIIQKYDSRRGTNIWRMSEINRHDQPVKVRAETVGRSTESMDTHRTTIAPEHAGEDWLHGWKAIRPNEPRGHAPEGHFEPKSYNPFE